MNRVSSRYSRFSVNFASQKFISASQLERASEKDTKHDSVHKNAWRRHTVKLPTVQWPEPPR